MQLVRESINSGLHFDLAKLEEEKNTLEAKMNEGDFWNDQKEALSTIARLNYCKDILDISCWYSGLSDKAARYGEADLIFGSDIIPNQNWVAQREDFRNHIRFDGTLLEVYASNSGWGFAEHAQIEIGEI